ncbi:MAG: DUF7133 domain-containing protein, partial [Verrucomicrobiota bacterium]
PTMIDHSHGSTAIAGIVYYADDLWPEEYQRNMFIGNVMTSRLNRDTLFDRGSSKTAREEPDFMTTTDPWFRPVDSQLGPDGSYYVADFYNRIIGHYEVPLNHPGRDRERGRIWRITYKDKRRDLPDLTKKSAEQLVEEFRSPNLPRRLLALNEYVDRVGSAGIESLKKVLGDTDAGSNEIVQSLWGLERLKALDFASIQKFATHNDPVVRTHIMHILSERHESDGSDRRPELLLAGLQDSNPLVQRGAADAMGQFPVAERFVTPILETLKSVPETDDHLRYTLRMALRDQLKTEAGSKLLREGKFSTEDSKQVASVCLAIPDPAAATFLLNHLQTVKEEPGVVANYVRHAVRYLDENDLPKMTSFIRDNYKNEVDQQLSFFKAMQEGSAQRGLKLTDEVKQWGTELAGQLLDSSDDKNQPWRNIPLAAHNPANPWFLQERTSADGKKATFLCSLPPGGESLTGTLQSKPFTIPDRLEFWVAGHDGYPDKGPQGNNLVRLVSSKNGNVLAKAPAPRNDTAQKISWDLSKFAGQQGYLEIVDADTGNAYAWIAAGRFEPAVVALPKSDPSQVSKRIQSAADIAKSLKAESLAPKMARLVVNESVDLQARAALENALVALQPNEVRSALAPLVGEASISNDLRKQISRALARGNHGDSTPVLVVAMGSIPSRLQVKAAQSLAGTSSGAETLLKLVEESHAPAVLLLDKTVQDKLAALNSAPIKERLAKVTRDLEPASEAVQKLIEQRRASYKPGKVHPEEGAKVFTQNCAVCHQIEGQGAVVGPQLDGIGSRGLERIIEDVLDPNRNVDLNFRTQIVVLKDGDVMSGLLRREEGELLVLVDTTGKEINIPKKDIESRRQSETSLMPANFGDVIPEQDFDNLLAYLLSKGVPVKH